MDLINSVHNHSAPLVQMLYLLKPYAEFSGVGACLSSILVCCEQQTFLLEDWLDSCEAIQRGVGSKVDKLDN